ncbi:MAG: rod shape-determining protein [Myxococcota bacterium]
MLDRFLGLISSDLAMDLGTANTLVFAKGEGVVCREPSVVAVRAGTRGAQKVLAVGREAKEMLGRTPANIRAIRPIRDGVIADFEVTEAMLRYFIRKVHERQTFVRPRIIIAVPSNITPVEKRAVKESAESAGAREVYLIEEPVAAAIGAGLPVTEPSGNMIVDIGGGTTEVAVISLGGIVQSRSARVAGDKMDDAIVSHAKKKYNLLIGEQTAEQVKVEIGSAFPDDDHLEMEVKGRDLIDGVPKTILVNADEIREALLEPITAMVDAVSMTLEKAPPELSADIVDRGIILAGGGALLRNLPALLRERTGLPVILAENPMQCVVLGAGRALDELETFRDLLSY